jgi:hypothetical protein
MVENARENHDQYQVCLYVGQTPPYMDGVKVIDLTPESVTEEAVLGRLRESGLTAADMRSKVFVLADCDPGMAVAVYGALLGFAGRRLDFSDGQVTPVDAAELDRSARNLADSGKPENPPAQVQVSPNPHPSLLTISTTTPLTPDDVSMVRYARRVRLAAPLDSTAASIAQLLIVAAIRARGGTDRLPYLVKGDEPEAPEDDPTAVVGLCLDTLRRAAADLRRGPRVEGDTLVDKAALTPRQRTLLAASAVPVEEALHRLGAAQDEESGLWHCPRPDRHTHGDANASMRVVNGRVRCFRCDQERIDSLRLVMDVKRLLPDEAAEWLLSAAA